MILTLVVLDLVSTGITVVVPGGVISVEFRVPLALCTVTVEEVGRFLCGIDEVDTPEGPPLLEYDFGGRAGGSG